MKIFCDFDGTTAINDVGNLLFRTFADKRCYDIVRSWKEGKINSKECLIRECQIARATKKELEEFADMQKLDPSFNAFVHFCRDKNIEVEIASDGLDFYIKRILCNHGLDSIVDIRSNHLVFLNENRLKPEFPYFEKGCGQCGNCKGYHVRKAKESGRCVIYVGDGLSDRCGANEADVVFAKRDKDLVKYCQANQIQYHEFDDFAEVLGKLSYILSESDRSG